MTRRLRFVPAATVLKESLSFPAGSFGDPDGLTPQHHDPDELTPQHLKDIVCANTKSELLEAITSLFNLMLAGGLKREVNEILIEGRLMALKKNDRGLRPITIG